MKIAILTSGDVNNRKGMFNNVHERAFHLKKVDNIKVDSFIIRHYDSWLFKLFRKKNVKIEDKSIVGDVMYNNLWVKHNVYDYILTYKLKLKDVSCKNQLFKFVDLFKDYDLLSAHSQADMFIAYLVKKKYGIPFVNTWHGGDINVLPFSNKYGFILTKLLIEKADFNFFVSKKLLETSNRITQTNNKDNLYTGPSDIYFMKNKFESRKKIGENTKKIVGFIGNLIPVKNIFTLPDIFEKLNKYFNDISFVIVGNGALGNELKKRFEVKNISNVNFKGKIEPENIPEIMNSLNVLVLPSISEGMPRVALEALACGVNVVGSNVGGIPESIGKENCFELDNDFIENISNRIIEILEKNEKPKPLSPEFSWDYAIEKEVNIYKRILS